jgi:hypothetical protein
MKEPLPPTNPGAASDDRTRAYLVPRRNGAAMASLIFGILGCVPEVTGVLAIVLGVVGLRRARSPNVGGKGLAGAGLALGILSVLAWSIGLGVGAYYWIASEPARVVAHQYLKDFSQQNIPAVLAASDPAVGVDKLESLSEFLRPLGSLKDATILGFYMSYSAPEWRFNGRAEYTNGDAVFDMTMIREGSVWKVRSFHIQPHPRSFRPPSQNVQV